MIHIAGFLAFRSSLAWALLAYNNALGQQPMCGRINLLRNWVRLGGSSRVGLNKNWHLPRS
jgi:hypothetical protein